MWGHSTTNGATNAIRMNECLCERFSRSIDQPRIDLFKVSRPENNITHETQVTDSSVTWPDWMNACARLGCLGQATSLLFVRLVFIFFCWVDVLFCVPRLAFGIWRLVRARFSALPICIYFRCSAFRRCSFSDCVVLFPCLDMTQSYSVDYRIELTRWSYQKMSARTVESPRVSSLVKFLIGQSPMFDYVLSVSHEIQSQEFSHVRATPSPHSKGQPIKNKSQNVSKTCR